MSGEAVLELVVLQLSSARIRGMEDLAVWAKIRPNWLNLVLAPVSRALHSSVTANVKRIEAHHHIPPLMCFLGRVANTPRYSLRELVVSNCIGIAPDDLTGCLTSLLALEHLQLTCCRIAINNVVPALHGLLKLQHLDLSYNRLEESGLEATASCLSHLQSLRALDLSCTTCSHPAALNKLCQNALPMLPKLDTLALGGNRLTAQVLTELGNVLGNVKWLYLQGVNQGSQRIKAIHGPGSIEALSLVLSQTQQLNGLDLSGNEIGAAGCAVVAEAIGRMSCLRLLDLSHNSMGADALDCLEPILHQLAQITSLDLSGNFIRIEAARSLAASLRHLTRLNTLVLGHNVLSDPGFSAICEAIPSIWGLVHLDLCDIDVTAHGLVNLSKALSCAKQLKTLGLAGLNMEALGLTQLVDGLRQLALLERLDLSRNQLTTRGAAALRGALVNSLRLRHLNLSQNGLGKRALEELGATVFMLVQLQELILTGNDFDAEAIGNLDAKHIHVKWQETVDCKSSTVGCVHRNISSQPDMLHDEFYGELGKCYRHNTMHLAEI